METNLPQEIADIIIDEVSKEPEPVLRATTLRACSLVSNIWVYRSQQHLFSKVAFDKVGFQKWRAKIKPRKDGPPHHVTHLHLTQEHGGSYLDGIVPDISHMTSFTNLRVLHVVNAPLQHEQVRLAYGTLGPTVSHLSLEGCLMDIYHLACFLRFFTNLEDLSILDPRILPGPKPEYPPEPPNAKQKINLELRVDVAYSGWPFVYELSLLPVAVHAITLVEPNPPLVSRGYGAGHCMSEINKLLAASHETLTRFRVHTGGFSLSSKMSRTSDRARNSRSRLGCGPDKCGRSGGTRVQHGTHPPNSPYPPNGYLEQTCRHRSRH